MNGLTMILIALLLASMLPKVHSVKWIRRTEKKWLSWLISALILIVIWAICWIRPVALGVVIIHFVVFFWIVDFIFFFINRKREKKIWIQNFVVIGFTFIYLGVGLFLGLHVFETDYTVENNKTSSGLKIAQIADSHLGCTFGGDGMAKYIEEIGKQDLDLMVITGDFVDDETKKADMVKACEAFGKLHTTYGVYFVFGNHDKGYYAEGYRDFNTDDLREELIKNNVVILEDEVVTLNEDYYLIGRQDKTEKNRMSMEELTKGLDDTRYRILLDHEPNDYDNEKGKVNLVLSGHTHGGNLFPINFLVMAANDQTYGMENLEGTDFIVTSGISAWAIPFNTCTISEYVIIDIR